MTKKITFLVIALAVLFTVNGFSKTTNNKAFDQGTMVLQTGVGYGSYGIYGDGI